MNLRDDDLPTLAFSTDSSGIATLTLNRPHVHNAFDDTVIHELLEILKHIDENPTIRVVILNATGKNFCAGADLEWMKRMVNFSEQENYHDALHLADCLYQLYQLSKPTIALVQGSAYGGGVGLIACCDFAIASHESNFCFSEVKLGLIPAVISPFIVAAIGERAARRYFLSAELFNASTALNLGLIHSLSTESELDLAGRDLAKRLLQNSPKALQATKKLLHDIHHIPLHSQLLNQVAERIAQIRVSEEGQAGLNAFLNKQQAPWITKSE